MVKCVYDYFYGAQADQFSFYRVPKVLFTNDRFREVSAEAKILYSILLERMDLSAKNGWIDDQGRVYIICTIEEIGDIFAGQTGTYDMHPIPGTEDLYYTIAKKNP
ncbi:MAG: replication initiator protein A [Parasporobacterium sp.]|nr:replication initiator protein A [Parasporobacterium sp.]